MYSPSLACSHVLKNHTIMKLKLILHINELPSFHVLFKRCSWKKSDMILVGTTPFCMATFECMTFLLTHTSIDPYLPLQPASILSDFFALKLTSMGPNHVLQITPTQLSTTATSQHLPPTQSVREGNVSSLSVCPKGGTHTMDQGVTPPLNIGVPHSGYRGYPSRHRGIPLRT